MQVRKSTCIKHTIFHEKTIEGTKIFNSFSILNQILIYQQLYHKLNANRENIKHL